MYILDTSQAPYILLRLKRRLFVFAHLPKDLSRFLLLGEGKEDRNEVP